MDFVCKMPGYMRLEFNRLNIYFAVSGHRILDLLCVPFVISDALVRCLITLNAFGCVCVHSSVLFFLFFQFICTCRHKYQISFNLISADEME